MSAASLHSPATFPCGQPVILWPENADMVTHSPAMTEVLIPESLVIVNQDHNVTEPLSLMLTKQKWAKKGITKFIPAYRNQIFVSDDERYNLRFLDAHSTPPAPQCEMPYHLLSYEYRSDQDNYMNYLIANAANPDWTMEFYSDDSASLWHKYEMETREPLAKLGRHFGFWDRYSKDVSRRVQWNGHEWERLYESPPFASKAPAPTPTPTPSLSSAQQPILQSIGHEVAVPTEVSPLVFILPAVTVGGFLLAMLLVLFVPRMLRKPKQGRIRLY